MPNPLSACNKLDPGFSLTWMPSIKICLFPMRASEEIQTHYRPGVRRGARRRAGCEVLAASANAGRREKRGNRGSRGALRTFWSGVPHCLQRRRVGRGWQGGVAPAKAPAASAGGFTGPATVYFRIGGMANPACDDIIRNHFERGLR